MTVALAVITDGRADYLAATLDSARDHLLSRNVFTSMTIVNDAGIDSYDAHLRSTYPDFTVVSHPRRMGLAAAVRTAWESIGDADYLFHLEEDFTFNGPVDVDDLAHVMRCHRDASQVVLKRQPWSPEECRAGGIVEMHPDDYTECETAFVPVTFTTHRRIFSLNPCLIPRRVVERGWPDSNEAGMTALLNKRRANRFAFFGGKFDPPRVTHIGVQRTTGWAL